MVGDLEIDPGRREVRLAGKSVSLKRREFDLLHYLARHAGMTLSRSRLLDAVWADQLPGRGDTRTVDVHIHRLRERLEARPTAPRYLHTVRGLGYALRPAGAPTGAARSRGAPRRPAGRPAVGAEMAGSRRVDTPDPGLVNAAVTAVNGPVTRGLYPPLTPGVHRRAHRSPMSRPGSCEGGIMEEPFVEMTEPTRNLEENYDGEFSSYYGRSQNGKGELFGDVLERRLSRRGAVKAGMVLGAGAIGAGAVAGAERAAEPAPRRAGRLPLTFQSIPLDITDEITLAPGYVYDRILSWGDPLFPGVPAFNLDEQSPGLQALQAGYNCDFLAFFPLPQGSTNANEGLLWINHEYTDEVMMFRSYRPLRGGRPAHRSPTRDQVDIALLAHGASVVHVRKDCRREVGLRPGLALQPAHHRDDAHAPLRARRRRPLREDQRGHQRQRRAGDAQQLRRRLDALGHGAHGGGELQPVLRQPQRAWGAPTPCRPAWPATASPAGASERLWEVYHDRFDVSKEPNESNRFGWIVEVDPYDPAFVPVKRTALGRLKHEAAAGTLAPNGRWVSYTGDDERFEYLYKFVSNRAYTPNNRANNLTLLDDGTLYVARLNDDGSGQWLPLIFGQGPLTPANGFFSQADVLIRARFAGDALGATKMDRPEDVEVNPVNRRVYMNCTNNTNRGAVRPGGAGRRQPRAQNFNGHVIEITENGGNHAGTTFRWDIFLLCGDPADPSTYFAGFPKDQVAAGMSSPDNISFDTRGNLWIATDGQTSRDAFRGPGDGGPAGHGQHLRRARSPGPSGGR